MTIQEALRPFGSLRCYRGMKQTMTAISLALENEDRLNAVIKEIYIPTALIHNTSASAVERNIRTVVQHALQVNPGYLTRIAGYPLNGAPSVSEFLAIMVSYLQCAA